MEMIRVAFFLASLSLALHVTEVSSEQNCTKVVDIAMVVDESGSIGKWNFKKVKSFLKDMISRFSVTPFGAHFGIVKYSTYPRLVFSLTKYTNVGETQTAVQNMEYRGGATYTGRALALTRTQIFGRNEDRKDVPNVLVLFSDGMSHDHRRAVVETKKMKNEGVAVLCVGIGRGRQRKRLIRQLKQLASKPEYVFKSAFSALQTIEDSLVKDMCEAADPCASQPCKNGGTCSREGELYKCNCTSDYEGEDCELVKWCPIRFSKRGCYEMPKSKEPAQLLFNRRNEIEWFDKWDEFLEKIVCDCGQIAKERSYKYFCIEFFGECWGYNYLDLSTPKETHGKCWGKRPIYNQCNHNLTKPICVGVASHGYVYELQK